MRIERMDTVPMGNILSRKQQDVEILKQQPLVQYADAQHVEDIEVGSPGHELPRGIEATELERESHAFVGSIDCGTTSSRFIIFDGEGNPVASHQIEFDNIYPESG